MESLRVPSTVGGEDRHADTFLEQEAPSPQKQHSSAAAAAALPDSSHSAHSPQSELEDNCMKAHKSSHSKHGAAESNNSLWVDGLLCAYEFFPGIRRPVKVAGKLRRQSGFLEGSLNAELTLESSEPVLFPESSIPQKPIRDDGGAAHRRSKFFIEEPDKKNGLAEPMPLSDRPKLDGSHWKPIGWARLGELVQSVQIDAPWGSSEDLYTSDECDMSVANLVAPYWEPKTGATWWCNLLAGHPHVETWLANSQRWLHPAVSEALQDESKLISDRMKHLYYEVPTRVAGGLLFELLGQSVGDPHQNEEDVPVVLRCWQAQKFMISSLHVKGVVQNLNVLGILEVEDLIGADGAEAPKSIYEVIAHLANRLARWDDRLFRKNVFGAADEVELKFVNRRENEDLALLSMIMNQEIRRLSTQVIRVKWSLHAREEILFELAQHLKGTTTQEMLATVRRGTREMIAEQEAVRDRIFTVQDAMHNEVRSVFQDTSVRITHNLTVFGGCGLILSIITSLFGINVDGIPGSSDAPLTFAIFSVGLIVLGILLVGVGFICLGLKRPITARQLAARKLELQQMVTSFQQAAEQHAKLRSTGSLAPPEHENRQNSHLDDFDYVLIM